MKIPLAWRNLTHNKRRLALALLGIGFVVLLMFMEIGFLNGIYDTMTLIYTKFNADLVMYGKLRTPAQAERFSRSRLYLARSCPAVDQVIPLYMLSGGSWKLPETGELRRIRVIAFDTRQQAFLPDVLPVPDLRVSGRVLFDSTSRARLGRPVAGTVTELNGREVRVIGLVPVGIDLDTDGNLIMDETTFFPIFGTRTNGGLTPTEVDLGLIQLKPGSDPAAALLQLRRQLPDDVEVRTVAQFVDEAKTYWGTNTAVGFLFHLGVVVGLIIGVIVCYQILFTDISDNLLPFATLKAMGYRNTYLMKIVLQQALLLAVLGFLMGLIGTFFLYRFLQWSTGLQMVLTVPRLASILFLTVAMCLIAGLMALTKVMRTDPADCF